jgi:hypothetical protein
MGHVLWQCIPQFGYFSISKIVHLCISFYKNRQLNILKLFLAIQLKIFIFKMNNLLTLFKSVTKLILPLVMFAVLPAHAKVILPACFTDNMVLQQKTQVNLWGKATAGKSLTITTSWNNKKYTVTADGTGNWKTKIATPVFGGPFTVTFNDGEIIT